MINSKIKILLVDDMDIIMDTIISHLQNLGPDFIFLKAKNGREACKLAAQHIPNLIIMDWEMPVMNGIEALILLKKNKVLRDIPVIMSSGFTESTNVREALDAGAIDYIRKPIDAIELIARVKSTLALQNSFHQLKLKQYELELEKRKFENLLKGLMPAKILEEIKLTGTSRPQRYKNASVIFVDLVGFTKKSTLISPKRLINELNDIFCSFDKIAEQHNCIRIKTIGDGYLAVCGLPETDEHHAHNIINAALGFKNYIINRNKSTLLKWEIRIGINSGAIIGSLIGMNNYLFDIFGKTVNTASRIQKYAAPMIICCGENTYRYAAESYSFKHYGSPELKGLGIVDVYSISDNKTESISSENREVIQYSLSEHYAET